MLYDEYMDRNYEKVGGIIAEALRAHGAVVGETAYGMAALEMLRNEIEVKGGLDETLEKVAQSSQFGDHVISYLRTALESSGIAVGEHIQGLEKDDVRAYVAHADAGNFAIMRESVTPSPIAVLATEILEIKEGERVADYGCGQGFFLAYAASHHPEASYTGYEIDPSVAAIASLRVHALGLDEYVSVECADLFELGDTGVKHSKIFSHYPIGMRFPRIQSNSAWLRKVASGHREYGRPIVFDWVFNQLVIDTLQEDGLGVVLMSDGALVNVSDEKVREVFVESGWIKSVVKLPKNVLPDTSAGSNLVELGFKSGGVNFVDAARVAQEGRRKSTISSKAAEVIATYVKEAAYNEASERKRCPELFDDEKGIRPSTCSSMSIDRGGDDEFLRYTLVVTNCTASIGAVADANYKLDSRYVDETIYEEEGWGSFDDYLGEHIVSISRGVTLKANELDEMTVSYDTGVKYLAPTGIEDGLIQDELPFLAELTPKLEKHALKTGDLLISRIGQPYRIAVADVPEGTTIIPSSNIFVVKVDPEDVDPYYLAAFLQSSKGEWELGKASSGSSVPSISAKTLKEIMFPYLDPYETEDTVEAYRAKLDEIRLTKERLDRARKDLLDLLD